MKTTVEIPDPLFREAKARAAMRGVPLKDLIIRGLQLALEDDDVAQPRRVTFPLVKSNGPMIGEEDVARALESFDLPG